MTVEPVTTALPLLRACTELGLAAFGAAACSVALLEADEEHLVFVAASGEGAGGVVGLRLPVGRGIAGWAVSSGQAIAIDDVRRDPRFAADVAESTGYVPRSILAMPLPTTEEGLGVIEVLDRTAAPHRDDLRLLGLLAHQAALAVGLAGAHDAVVASAQEDTSARGGVSPDPITAVTADLRAADAAAQETGVALLRTYLDHQGPSRGPASLV